MIKKVVIGLILAIVIMALVVTTACIGGNEGEVSQQLVKVTRGDLTLSVTGSGKIETFREARPTFGSAGKLDRILVQEGDEVGEGDVLARLDTSALELALSQAKMALVQAEVALKKSKLAKQTAEYNLKNTEGMEDSLGLAVLNAEIGLEQAQRDLDRGIQATDYLAAVAQLKKAETWYKFVVEDWPRDSAITDDWHMALERAERQLEVAQANYDSILSGYDSREITLKKRQVEAAEMTLAQAQKDLDDLAEDIAMQRLQIESAEQDIMQAEQSVELARQSLNDAQRQLDEATIFATFDGIVAQVLAKEGDNIPSPSMAPQAIVLLIDPSQMELVVEVDEIDIPLVRLGQEAVISVDALPDAEFEGRITAVYPVPKEEGGVVLYEVRLSLDVPEDSLIKVGMSASADVLMDKRSNVLIVPSRAIYQNSQGETIVKVMADKQVQERTVVVGLDDGLRVEIISGLSEGETVVIESKARSAPSMGMS